MYSTMLKMPATTLHYLRIVNCLIDCNHFEIRFNDYHNVFALSLPTGPRRDSRLLPC